MSADLAWQLPVEAISQLLTDGDIASLRSCAKDWKQSIDGTICSLRPTCLKTSLLQNRALPGLKCLRIDQLYLLQPQQLECISRLTQLTQLSLGGSCVSCVRNQHLAFIGRLANLQQLSIRGCPKVHLSVLSNWHSLTQLRSLTLIGSAFSAATDTRHLQAFLAASGAALAFSLTRLVLGDGQGLSFLSDSALQGIGGLMGPGNVLRELDLSGSIDITYAGIRELAGLSGLQQLKLHNCMKLNASAVPVIASFTGLTHLCLRGCSQFQDAQLQQLLRCLGHLQHLNLQSCGGLRGAFLCPELCRSLGALHTLNLSYCHGLAPEFAGQLSGLAGLRRLDLSGCCVVASCRVLQLLGRVSQLRELVGANWRLKGVWQPGSAAAAGGGAGAGEGNTGSGSDVQSAMQLDGCSTGCNAAGGARWDELLGHGSFNDGSNGQQQARKKMRAEQQHDEQLLAPAPRLVPPQLHLLQLPNLVCDESLLQGIVSSLPRSLTGLDLSNCRVPGFGPGGDCLKPLGHLCPQLKSLNLSSCTGGMAETALSFLGGMPGLTALHVDHVFAQHQGAQAPVGNSGSSSDSPVLFGSSSGGGGSFSSGFSSSGSLGGGSSYSSSLGGGSSAGNKMFGGGGSSSSCGQHAGVAALLATSPLSRNLLGGRGSGSSGRVDVAVVVRRSLFGATSTVKEADPGACAAATPMLAAAGDMFTAATQLQLQCQPSCLQQLRCLQKLSIRFSPWLDDRALSALSGLVRSSLMSLELVACHGFSGLGFSSWAAPGADHVAAGAAAAGAGVGRQLTRLNFTGCSGLDDEGLQCLVAALAGRQQVQQDALQQACGADGAGAVCGVRELVLAGCKGFGDAGVAALAALSSLRLLSLSSNRDITSRAISALFPALRHVRHLQLASCSGLDDAALTHLATGSALTTVDVRGCWKLTDAGVFELLLRSPSLLQLNVECCHRLSSSCCPPSFQSLDADGSGRFAAGTGGSGAADGGTGGSSRRPNLLVRVSMQEVLAAGVEPAAGAAANACCSGPYALQKAGPCAGAGSGSAGELPYADGSDDGGCFFGDMSSLARALQQE